MAAHLIPRARAAGLLPRSGWSIPWLMATVTCLRLTDEWSFIHTNASAASERLARSGRVISSTDAAGSSRMAGKSEGRATASSMTRTEKSSRWRLDGVLASEWTPERAVRLEQRRLHLQGRLMRLLETLMPYLRPRRNPPGERGM